MRATKKILSTPERRYIRVRKKREGRPLQGRDTYERQRRRWKVRHLKGEFVRLPEGRGYRLRRELRYPNFMEGELIFGKGGGLCPFIPGAEKKKTARVI